MTGEGRSFNFPPEVKKIVLIVLLLLIIDIMLAGLGSLFPSERISFFLGKSATHVLCDLLFLEGAIIFVIGVFLAAGMLELFASSSPSSLFSAPRSSGEDVTESRQKQFSVGIVLMFVGAILIVLSVAIGTVLL